MHPSARQSQVDINDPKAEKNFPSLVPFTSPFFFSFSLIFLSDFVNATALEIVLEPGDVLYIPPFYSHYVCVVGQEISLSVSTHSDAEAAHVRETIIDLSLDIGIEEDWALQHKINLLTSHFFGLFKSKKELHKVLSRTIDASYSHFEIDTDAEGLYDQILEARKNFPSNEEITKFHNEETFGKKYQYLFEMGKFARNTLGKNKERKEKLSKWIIEILLTDYIQDTLALYIGALNVDPYLRYLINRPDVLAALDEQ